jgi:hypothetical protein
MIGLNTFKQKKRNSFEMVFSDVSSRRAPSLILRELEVRIERFVAVCAAYFCWFDVTHGEDARKNSWFGQEPKAQNMGKNNAQTRQ